MRPIVKILLAASVISPGIIQANDLQQKATLSINTPKNGDTPLHQEVKFGTYESVASLIEGKADVEAKNNEKKTPLLLATYYVRPDIVNLLLDKKANVKTKDKDGATALHLLTIRKSVESLTDAAHQLLDAKADIHATDQNGDTPLHSAASHGRNGLVRTLLRRGANIEATNKQGNTPLLLAAFWKREKTVETLLDHKADIEVVNKDKKTLLHLIANNNTIGYFDKILARRRAGLEIKDKNGDTPLCIAAYNGHLEAVGILLNAGADVHTKGWKRLSPLEQANRRLEGLEEVETNLSPLDKTWIKKMRAVIQLLQEKAKPLH